MPQVFRPSLSRSRPNVRRTLLGLAAAVAMTAALAMPSSASALSRTWHCGLIPPDTWCEHPDNHSWVTVTAYWNGTAIPMCAKIVNHPNYEHNGTRACYTAPTVYSTSQPNYVGPNTWAQCANGSSGTNKTITCWATT